MIGEFLKLSSADLPHTIEMVRKTISRPVKGTSPSKDASHFEATTKPTSHTLIGVLQPL